MLARQTKREAQYTEHHQGSCVIGGIPPDQLERIFEKFHRASEGDNRPAGTGLGLSISRGFIEGMGGHIEAANRSDRSGARFTITLPVPETAAVAGAPASVA